VRIVSCLLPKQSPWLNAIEPKWVHGKRKVVEPDGLLGTYELAERVCRVFGCPHYEHLSKPFTLSTYSSSKWRKICLPVLLVVHSALNEQASQVSAFAR
jgi:hypothetical protein